MSLQKERKTDEKRINIILGCLLLMLLTSLPFFTDFLMNGTFLSYQLIRIEALKNGLAQYGLNLWAKPDWINPLGFSFAFFYGDTFLYIPAFFRMIGINVQMSYRLFNTLINIITVLTSYYAFRRIFKNEYTGLLGAALYSFSIYRLFLMFSEDELGEVIALAFLPLVIYALAMLLFQADHKRKEQAFLWLALGMTGIFRSHILCFGIIVLVILAGYLICFKEWKRKELWGQTGLAVMLFLLLNGSYLYSMLQYLKSGEFVVNPVSGQAIQTNGVQIAQLFMCFYQAGASHNFGTNGVNNAVPVGVGFVLLVAVLVFFYMIFIYGSEFEKKEKRNGWIVFWIGFAGCLLGLLCFPWDSILKINGFTSSMVSMIQAPWHFLVIPLAAFSVLACITYEMFRRKFPEYYRIYGVAMFVLDCICGSYLAANMLYTYNFSRIKMPAEIPYADIAETGVNGASATGIWIVLELVALAVLAGSIIWLYRSCKAEKKTEE
jgi:hypothetical protein